MHTSIPPKQTPRAIDFHTMCFVQKSALPGLRIYTMLQNPHFPSLQDTWTYSSQGLPARAPKPRSFRQELTNLYCDHSPLKQGGKQHMIHLTEPLQGPQFNIKAQQLRLNLCTCHSTLPPPFTIVNTSNLTPNVTTERTDTS